MWLSRIKTPLIEARRLTRTIDGEVVTTLVRDIDITIARGTTLSLPASGGTLRPQDWKSGERPSSSSEAVGQGKVWVVEVVVPFGGAEEMVKDLKQKVYPSKTIQYLAARKDGDKELRRL